ncbi:dihydrofolate reductase family protein [Oceanicella sp. SM1341]|uniref:dihydrofolate reductase family protein n=1 Tax=Oceanicella sp. SM1341 TaxID=1548889 RepID=UPI000E486C67|nr:dihydrofolate reductase family protein [Oceanicella sp. SM1341]
MPRPEILCHMIASLDGRLAAERWNVPEEVVVQCYDSVAARLGAGGWIVGRRTMEHYLPAAAPRTGPATPGRADRPAAAEGRSLAICFDRNGRLAPAGGTLEGDHLVVVVSGRVADTHVERLAAAGVSVFFSGPEGEDLGGALTRIAETFGVSRLLLEGGGTLNGAFLAAGLIDQTSTIVFPVLDGARGIGAIYDHAGATVPTGLELVSAEVLEGGAVWLRHRLVPAATR